MATEQIAIPGAEQFEKPHALSIIERALLDPNLAADKVAALLEVQLKYEANEARKRFEEAFAQFKRNAPTILKSKHVKFTNRDGSVTEYWHADLANLTKVVGEGLRAVGITLTWDASESSVTCVLSGFGHTHRGASLTSPADKSGGKNDVQAVGSRTSYLMRYTALMTIGEVPEGAMPDDDGKTEGMSETAIDEYCIAMNDSSSLPELQPIFKECWEKAKHINDRDAQERLRKVYEARKRSILEARQ